MAEASGEDFSAAFEDLPGLEEMSNSEDDLCHTAGDNYVSIYKEGTMLENWTGKKVEDITLVKETSPILWRITGPSCQT